MVQSPSKFCRGSEENWDAFCASARIVESTDHHDDLLLKPITLPTHLPEIVAASLTGSNQKYPFSPLISQADLQFSSQAYDIQLVPEDYQRIPCTSIRIRKFYAANSDAIAGGTYCVEFKVHVVKYDQRRVPHGPTSIATAGGAVVIPLPLALRGKSVVYAGTNYHVEYIQSFIEFKGVGLHNNGRQAILDSAAMQAVNRSLGLVGVKNYAFSVDRHHVDTITSWWEKIGTEGYRYRYMRRDNAFVLDTPIGWFRFYSFLCRLREYHHVVCEALRTASPSLLTARELFCEELTQHLGGGNEGSPHDGGQGHQSEMQWRDADGDIQLGDEAATYTQISVEDFCRGESDEEDDDDDFDDEDVAPKDVGAKVQLWQKDVVPGFGIDLALPLHDKI
ncbi:hypothetical protein GGX14DRAFT_542424 [Mycena pura]|uniref:Uncharacterized protein n=1 Tax=Mycena pura TaxID=153505 RepID=A0AAD6VL83_9AGAR|nr:hypothetical protein GGX14DRAFT_542424 [Mycena pura]